MGRAAGVDASGAAVLPPAALSPVTRYKQEPEDRSGLWSIGRLALWALAGVAMVVVAVVAGDYLFIKQSVEAVRPHSRDVIRALPQLAKTPTPGHAAIARKLHVHPVAVWRSLRTYAVRPTSAPSEPKAS